MKLARAASGTNDPSHNDSSSSTGSGQPGVTSFVFVHCTSTGQLSSCSLQVFSTGVQLGATASQGSVALLAERQPASGGDVEPYLRRRRGVAVDLRVQNRLVG
jgi:hypothetical protein